VPVKIVKTPPPVLAKESAPIPYPAPGSSFAYQIFFFRIVAPGNPALPAFGFETVVHPFPAEGSAFWFSHAGTTVVARGVSQVKDVYKPISHLTGGQGGSAFQP
jgi:hypothetical protein